MRSIVLTVSVLCAFLVAAAPLAAQPKEPMLKPREAGDTQISEINGKTLAQWIKQIKDPDAGLAELAIRTVMLFGPNASREASPALVDALASPDTSLRVNACISLTMIGVYRTQMTRAVTALVRRMNEDPQAIVRFHAAVALGRLEPDDARPAVAALVYRRNDQNSWEIRRAVAYALGKAGRATKDNQVVDMRAAHALIATFSGIDADRSADVRLTAVMALGSLGIPGMPQDKQLILQALNVALKDRYKAVVIWAHMGLMADGEPAEEHLPAIAKFLGPKNDYESRLEATRALGFKGKEAKSEIPVLIKELGDPVQEPLLVAAASWALGEMGRDASDAMPQLQAVLDKKDVDESVKTIVKEAMDKIGGKPRAKS